jgi:hypothetical protein
VSVAAKPAGPVWHSDSIRVVRVGEHHPGRVGAPCPTRRGLGYDRCVGVTIAVRTTR